MPYVKVTGYIDVPDEDYAGGQIPPLTHDGDMEVQHCYVGDLEDLKIERDDRVSAE